MDLKTEFALTNYRTSNLKASGRTKLFLFLRRFLNSKSIHNALIMFSYPLNIPTSIILKSIA